MNKYYTRACNFYYGKEAKSLIKTKKALPLCGNKNIAFNKLEIISRNKKKVKNKIINIQDVKFLKRVQIFKIKNDLKKITSKRKNFIKNINFSRPTIMGILNLTPDSFSDGGVYNKKAKSFKHIDDMIKSGANIIDVGGESTRPGSKDIHHQVEFKRIKNVLKRGKRWSQIVYRIHNYKHCPLCNTLVHPETDYCEHCRFRIYINCLMCTIRVYQKNKDEDNRLCDNCRLNYR